MWGSPASQRLWTFAEALFGKSSPVAEAFCFPWEKGLESEWNHSQSEMNFHAYQIRTLSGLLPFYFRVSYGIWWKLMEKSWWFKADCRSRIQRFKTASLAQNLPLSICLSFHCFLFTHFDGSHLFVLCCVKGETVLCFVPYNKDDVSLQDKGWAGLLET